MPLDESLVVRERIGIPGQQHAVVRHKPVWFDSINVLHNIRRAVVRKRIVKLRLFGDLIHPPQHIDE